MNKIIHLTVFLLLVAGISGLAIGYVNGMTAPVIEELNAQKLIDGYAEVYPGAEEYVVQENFVPSDPSLVSRILAMEGGETVGVLYSVNVSGYGGTVEILVGFGIEAKEITGVKVLNQSETPGLGANCTNAWFSERYIGKTAEQDLTVVKVETSSPAEVQAITAATITSAAITDGVNAARQDFAASYGSL